MKLGICKKRTKIERVLCDYHPVFTQAALNDDVIGLPSSSNIEWMNRVVFTGFVQ